MDTPCTSLVDVVASPAIFELLKALDTYDAQCLRQSSQYVRESIDAVLPQTMHVYKCHIQGSRYPSRARPPKRLVWNQSPEYDQLSDYKWKYNDSKWFYGVEEMWGEEPGMISLLHILFSSFSCRLLLDRLKVLMASATELVDRDGNALAYTPNLDYIHLTVNGGCHPRTDVLLLIGAVGLSSLDMTMGSETDIEFALKYAAGVVRSVQHTLTQLRIKFMHDIDDNVDLLTELMESIGCCNALRHVNLVGVPGTFKAAHANKLPPSVREVFVITLDLSDWDFPRTATVRGGTRQCVRCHPRRSTHPTRSCIRSCIRPCIRSCIRCGCSSEFDRHGERICWCDACEASECQYEPEDDECAFSFTTKRVFDSR